MCWSLERLASGVAEDELLAEDGLAEYEAVGGEFGFKYLGVAETEALTALLQDVGQVEEQRWTEVSFSLPPHSLSGCWWVTNPSAPGGESAKFVNRSLAVLTAELHQNRVATVGKMTEVRNHRRMENQNLIGQVTNTRTWTLRGAERCFKDFQQMFLKRGTGPTSLELDSIRTS